MELLRDMALFVQVAEMKSFSRAAEALDMAASSLSQRTRRWKRRWACAC